MGHLSVAADDYLLTGERRVGGGPAREGRRGPGAAPAARDLWQVSTARFPDRSTGLEFIWVTVTGGVCCDKRLMGRAPGSCLDTCGAGGRGAGLPSFPLPRARPSLTLLGSWSREGVGVLLPWHTLPNTLHPLQPSVPTLLPGQQPGAQ